MGSHHARYVSLALLLLGLSASVLLTVGRLAVEADNRTVALILDYDQIRLLASVSGSGTREVLERLRAAGATHVAVTEETMYDVLSSGEVAAVPVRPASEQPAFVGAVSFAGPPETIQRIRRSLRERLGQGDSMMQLTADSAGSHQLSVRYVDPADLTHLGIGYPRGAVHEVNLAGLSVVPRPRAEGNQWEAAMIASLVLAEELNGDLLVFSGNAAPGYPDSIAGAAQQFVDRGLIFGCVEFGKQYGDLALAARLPQNLVRVHSISDAEMLGMSVQRAVDRFALAVRERNIRVCYVRLFGPSGADPIASAESYVGRLAERLRSYGFELGPPRPYGRWTGTPWARALAMLGALGALSLCLTELLGWRSGWVLALLGAGAVLVIAAAVVSLDSGTKLAALLAALALPTLAVGRHRPPAGTPLLRWRALGQGLLLFAGTSAMSALGGLLVIGCLADARFITKLDQFSGVKLAHLLPLVGVLLLQVGWDMGSRERATGEAPLTTLARGWGIAAQVVVKYWHAALLLGCAAALGVLLLRTANESGIGVSSLELQVRAALDRIIGVRPRTKEVLIGHPLLILGLARALSGRGAGRWVLLSLGAIGQVSLVNTFCHLHTPLPISVIRTLHGLWCGALVGVGLYVIVEIGERAWSRVRDQLVPP